LEWLVKIYRKGGKEMRERSRVTVVLATWGMVMAMVVPGICQERSGSDMQILLEKIRADKKLLVAQNMQLSEAEAKAFWPVYDEYQDELFLLRARTVNLIKDYSDAYENMGNDTAKKLVDELMNIEQLGPKLRLAYLPKFREVLPEVKVARYYQIENKIQAVLMYELAENIPLVKAGE
jgi:hypothetical protein